MATALGIGRRKLAIIPIIGSLLSASSLLGMGFVMGLSLLSAVPVFLGTSYFTQNAQRSEFVIAAEVAASRLAREVDVTLTHLRAVKGFYRGSVHVSRDEFSTFVQTLRPSEAIQALEWVPRVKAADRSAMEAAAQKDGFSDFQFSEYTPAGDLVPALARPEYFPVYYLEPHAGNEAAFGFDLGSNPARQDAMHRARDSGNQAASGRVSLVQTLEGQYGILVFDPFYTDAAVSLDVHIERLEGFALGVFRVGDLVREAIPEDQFQVAIFDRSALPEEQQIYPMGEAVEPGLIKHTVWLTVADRLWAVRLAPTASFQASALPWFAAGSWLAALLVLWISRELISSRRHGEQLAVVNGRLGALSRQRQQAIAELERSNRELDDFAYIASHDLREPLRAINNHAALLIESYEDRVEEDGKKRLHRLMALSQRMERLIADLLNFSRLGRGDEAMETIDLNHVIADIEASLAETLQKRNAKIVLTTPLPKVRAQRPGMMTLFQNLIINGIKYNDADRKIIEIGMVEVEDDGRTAALAPGEAPSTQLPAPLTQFYVRDNGIGIDKQFKDDVFRIFKRLHSVKAYGEGTGAGLSFVKKIIESYGGSVWLNSTVGQGTTFFFTLVSADKTASSTADSRAA